MKLFVLPSLAAIFAATGIASAANFIDLNFGSASKVSGQNVWRFSNVATVDNVQINATLTVAPLDWTNQTQQNKYSLGNATTNPTRGPVFGNYANRGDIEFNYSWTRGVGGTQGSDTGGFSLIIEFFSGSTQGGGGYSQAYSMEAFRILLFDVDGESPGHNGSATQDEFARAYVRDATQSYGLVSYQLGLPGTGIPPATATQTITANEKYVTYQGGGWDRPETSRDNAFLLNYENTDKVRIDLYATTPRAGGNNQPSPNWVFTAISGDIPPLTEEDFNPPLDVPEPSVILLLGLGSAGLLRRRR